MKPDSRPLISVIVATRNADKTLQRCIDSVLSQTYPHRELIIIDGASADKTVDILKANERKISYWISEPDRGIAQAWNKAVVKAKGDWLIFLGADDELLDEFIFEKAAGLLDQMAHREYKVVYGKIALTDQKGDTMATLGRNWGRGARRTFFSEKNLIPHQACFHHSSLFDEYGLFDERFQIAVDYEFFIRVFLKEGPCFINTVISKMAFGGLSHHPFTLLKMQREFNTALSKHGLRRRSYRFLANLAVYHLLEIVIFIGGENAARWYLDILRLLTGKSRTWTIHD